ncbi:MAG: hypothetical protein ACRBN8_42855 [Nannocystales bacterium]
MNRLILVLPLVGLSACDPSGKTSASAQAAAKTAEPNSTDRREAPTAPSETTRVTPPTPAAKNVPPASAEASGAGCGDFVFELDNPTDASADAPNDDNPVARTGHKQNLTLRFSCGDEERIEDIDSLGFDCHGASCGCTFKIDQAGAFKAADPDECDTSSDAEVSDFLKGKDMPNVLASWAVITAVERAHIAQVQRYSVTSVEGGFDVVRLSSGSEETKVVFKHR